jgi:hypothetical protein
VLDPDGRGGGRRSSHKKRQEKITKKRLEAAASGLNEKGPL